MPTLHRGRWATDQGGLRGQRRTPSGTAVQRARRRGRDGAARVDEREPAAARRRPLPRGRLAATSSTSSLDGKVKLGRTSSDGRENLLAILGPGQMFGELSLFDPGPRSATVTAVTDAAFASLSHDDLLRWLEGRPVVARGLLAQIAEPAPQGQRRRRRPGLLRRPRPRRQGAARPRRPLRPHRRRRRPRPPRPHPGGARPAGRRLPRDRQQGARRLRLPRLAAPRAPLGRDHGRRAPRPPRPLTGRPRPGRGAPRLDVAELSFRLQFAPTSRSRGARRCHSRRSCAASAAASGQAPGETNDRVDHDHGANRVAQPRPSTSTAVHRRQFVELALDPSYSTATRACG